MICLRLSIISLYPAVDMRLSISDPTPFAILLLLQLELLALKSLVTIKHIGSSSFVLPKGWSRFVKKYSNLSWFWLGDR